MEIERKFIPNALPDHLSDFPHKKIEQAYLNTAPVIRIRRQDDEYILTYKGGGMMAREEYNLPLNRSSYEHLLKKADGNVITKTRYLIPLKNHLTAELDIFEGIFSGMVLVEVEFSSVEEAEAFEKPDWFGEDVTYDGHYHNSYLSQVKVKSEEPS